MNLLYFYEIIQFIAANTSLIFFLKHDLLQIKSRCSYFTQPEVVKELL
jgi:hypothetical protein